MSLQNSFLYHYLVGTLIFIESKPKIGRDSIVPFLNYMSTHKIVLSEKVWELHALKFILAMYANCSSIAIFFLNF